jgi:restriction system protein
MKTRISRFNVKHSARGIPTYSLELWHDGLKKHRVIKGEAESIVKLKATLQAQEWEQRWSVVKEKEKSRSEKFAGKWQADKNKTLAIDRSNEAQLALDQLSSLLIATLEIDDTIDWEELKDKAVFPEPKLPAFQLPEPPALPVSPREPLRSDNGYTPSFGMLDKIFSSRRARAIEQKDLLFAEDYKAWQIEAEHVRRQCTNALFTHDKRVVALRDEHKQRSDEWHARYNEFKSLQKEQHAAVEQRRSSYKSFDPVAVLEYCDLVLSSSSYPNSFPQEFDLDYDNRTKTLIVDYQLPSPDNLPRLKAVKYIANRDEFEDQFISDVQASKLYDDVLYQIVLRTVHELFEADSIKAIDSIVFNGIVIAVDKSSGKPTTACVVSLRANSSEFQDINLGLVEPKACFKSLKGVGSSKLHGLSPVPPIMQLRKEDGRFVSAYDVAETLDGSVNLAAMDWEDFEHLIREIFEKEFSSSGGEVKVTRASRDGGVDAIAFDPDPIRGGKIVIQAKRYTNTVGVSAVRDLYGTVLNEGATKGVLVTTSDYGPDSYSFASGKPIVLLSGANLLHMLEKHGHRARIDLHEAKKLATKS